MGWTFYNSSGEALTSFGPVALTDLDIDGGTAIGEAIVGADLFIADNGAGGTNVKVTATEIATFIGSAITREGGQTSEGTTTSTSATDLLSATSLTIAAAQPFTLIFDGRKTSGAAANAAIGLKLNSTVIVEANVSDMIWRANGSADEATSGSHNSITSPRITNYVDGGNMGGRGTTVSAGQVYRQGDGVIGGNPTAAFITADITSIVLRGISANGSVTLGADEMHVYSWVIS